MYPCPEHDYPVVHRGAFAVGVPCDCCCGCGPDRGAARPWLAWVGLLRGRAIEQRVGGGLLEGEADVGASCCGRGAFGRERAWLDSCGQRDAQSTARRAHRGARRVRGNGGRRPSCYTRHALRSPASSRPSSRFAADLVGRLEDRAAGIPAWCRHAYIVHEVGLTTRRSRVQSTHSAYTVHAKLERTTTMHLAALLIALAACAAIIAIGIRFLLAPRQATLDFGDRRRQPPRPDRDQGRPRHHLRGGAARRLGRRRPDRARLGADRSGNHTSRRRHDRAHQRRQALHRARHPRRNSCSSSSPSASSWRSRKRRRPRSDRAPPCRSRARDRSSRRDHRVCT